MSHNQSSLKIKDYEGLINWAGRRLVVRAKSEGYRLEHDDAYQELVIVWMKCARQFDPTRGVKFSTYFARAALHEYQSIVNRVLGSRANRTVGLNSPLVQWLSGESSQEIIDTLADENAENAETRVIRDQQAKKVMEGNHLLRRLAEICLNPDEEMKTEIAALRHRDDWLRGRGGDISGQSPTELTPRMIGRIMRFNWRDRRSLLEAIQEAA